MSPTRSLVYTGPLSARKDGGNRHLQMASREQQTYPGTCEVSSCLEGFRPLCPDILTGIAQEYRQLTIRY